MKIPQIITIFIIVIVCQVTGFVIGYKYYEQIIDKDKATIEQVVSMPDNSELEACRADLRRDEVSLRGIQELADKKGFGQEVKNYLQKQEQINY
jgi:hypothetical protein